VKIYLIRHTSVNVPPGICYGQTDVPLNTSFEEEAGMVKKNLEHLRPNALFSSPLSRCTKLADFCGFHHAVPDERLKELNFGDWEGQEWNKIDMSVWKTDWVHPPAPNGESFMQLYRRVAAFFDDLKNQSSDTVLIFTHGGVISCARVYFQQADIHKTFGLMPKYGEIVEFELYRPVTIQTDK
jgi:alpha-ribazole phosphatase